MGMGLSRERELHMRLSKESGCGHDSWQSTLLGELLSICCLAFSSVRN